jgi:hypothetical protein
MDGWMDMGVSMDGKAVKLGYYLTADKSNIIQAGECEAALQRLQCSCSNVSLKSALEHFLEFTSRRPEPWSKT